MSTLISFKSQTNDLARLDNLPDDITRQILDYLQPVEIATFSQLNQLTYHTITNSSIWKCVARQYLSVVQDVEISSASVYQLAKSLSCHWSVSSGLFVAGVPVHRRSGFTFVNGKGGIEVALGREAETKDACYVFGGRFSKRAIPYQSPSMDLQFAYNSANGPFPVNGLTCRIVYAVEPPKVKLRESGKITTEKSAIPQSQSLSYENNNNNNNNNNNKNYLSNSNKSVHQNNQLITHATTIYDDDDDDDINNSDTNNNNNGMVQAKIKIKVNSYCVQEQICKPSSCFSELIVHIPSHALVKKPAFNVLSIEYSRDSTAGYWLRDVSLTPNILPLTSLPANIYEFPLAVSEQDKESNKCNTNSSASSASASSSSSPSSSSSSPVSTSSFSSSPSPITRSNDNHVNTNRTRSVLVTSPPPSNNGIEQQQQSVNTKNGLRPLSLQQFGDLLHISGNNKSSNTTPKHGERVEKLRNNVGKRPKHMYHKQNQHCRSPRSPRYQQQQQRH